MVVVCVYFSKTYNGYLVSLRLRQEMEIKLKLEEIERQKRRERVEKIMLRTRNQVKGSGNASTKVSFCFLPRDIILMINCKLVFILGRN